MNSNHDDFSINIWTAISVFGPIINFIYELFNGQSYTDQGGVGVLVFIIFFGMMSGLPLYFLLVKISKKVYDLNLPTWFVKLILLLATLLFILAIHLVFFHKKIFLNASSRSTTDSHYLCYFFSLVKISKFYLFATILAFMYFKIERKELVLPLKTREDILDDNFNFKK